MAKSKRESLKEKLKNKGKMKLEGRPKVWIDEKKSYWRNYRDGTSEMLENRVDIKGDEKSVIMEEKDSERIGENLVKLSLLRTMGEGTKLREIPTRRE